MFENGHDMKTLLVLLLLTLYSAQSSASEPEFFIKYTSCSNTVGYLILSHESLKTMPGDTTSMGCSRSADDVFCSFIFDNAEAGHKGNKVNYKILIDSPPYLHFSTPNGSEYISIDTNQHAAVLVSRVLGEKYAGSKVCQGLYATSFEMKNIK